MIERADLRTGDRPQPDCAACRLACDREQDEEQRKAGAGAKRGDHESAGDHLALSGLDAVRG